MTDPTTHAQAHPNIALVKYWGKADVRVNIPATPSLSITLDTLASRTSVRNAQHNNDEISLNGEPSHDLKILNWLTQLRQQFDIPPLQISSKNNFPTASGLASSASGFAALITAINQHCALNLDVNQRSIWARRASASAARSIHGGWTSLAGPQWYGQPLESNWAVNVVVAITDRAPKTVASSVGMTASRDQSAFYPAWVDSTADDYLAGQTAVADQDFAALADIAEHSCLKMHGLMLSTGPGLMYWNPATLAALHAIRSLRAEGHAVFFTVDAGPQVKAVCLPEAATLVERTLTDIEGVHQTIRVGLGDGAQLIAH